MCLIAISPRGTDKYSEFFLQGIRNSAMTNNHGYGYSYKRTKANVVHFSKGFRDLEVMLDQIKKHNLDDDDELIVHLRWASAGAQSMANTHPFFVNYNSEYAHTALQGIIDFPAVFHNGTFSNFIDESDHSDTFNFTNSFLKIKGIWNMFKNDREKFMQVFKDLIGSNKLAIMGKELEETIIVGNFVNKEGYIFSNTSYENNYRRPIESIDTSLRLVKGGKEANAGLEEQKNLATSISSQNLNTKNIKVTPANFRDFRIKSHCIITGCGVRPILKDSFFTIAKYSDNDPDVILSVLNEASTYRTVSKVQLENGFILLPRQEVQGKYFDYLKLKRDIAESNSAVKKVWNKVLGVSGRSTIPDKIRIKHGVLDEPLNTEAIIMFLKDNEKYINKFKFQELCAEIKAKQVEEFANCMC